MCIQSGRELPPWTLRRSWLGCAIEVARRGASRGGLTPSYPPPFHPARCKRPRLRNGPPPHESPERFSLFSFVPPVRPAHTPTLAPRVPAGTGGGDLKGACRATGEPRSPDATVLPHQAARPCPPPRSQGGPVRAPASHGERPAVSVRAWEPRSLLPASRSTAAGAARFPSTRQGGIRWRL